MEQSLPLNPWLTDAILRLKARHTDADLRESYRMVCENEYSISWKDFLADTAIEEALRENPFLDQDILDTDLSDHTKDILRMNHVDSVVDLMQYSWEDLAALKWLSDDEICDVINLIERGGLKLEEDGRTLKHICRWQVDERRPAQFFLERARKDAKAILDRADLWDTQAGEKASACYDRAFQSLQVGNVEKGFFLTLLKEQATMLLPFVKEKGPLNTKAIDVATKLVRLCEYLFGPLGETINSWELLGEILQEAGEYTAAYEYGKKSLSMRLIDPHTTPRMLLLRYNNLGTCLMELGRNEEALKHLLKALEIGEKEPDTDPNSLFMLCHNIAEAYSRIGDDEQSFVFLGKADKYYDDPTGR